jgi:hypothetical protein
MLPVSLNCPFLIASSASLTFVYLKKFLVLVGFVFHYVETRADKSGYANHRVTCLVVIGSSFDSEQVFQVSNGYL